MSFGFIWIELQKDSRIKKDSQGLKNLYGSGLNLFGFIRIRLKSVFGLGPDSFVLGSRINR